MKNKSPAITLISVIIPCYNVEDYLDDCFEYLLEQSYPHLEIICVDNNSSDGTYRKLLRFEKKILNLKVLKEMKPGAPAARNTGLAQATGDWIQFLDADDLLLPKKITNQFNLVKDNINSDPALVIGDCFVQKKDGTKIQKIAEKKDPWLGLFSSRLGITSSNLWNRKVVEKAGGWDESIISGQEYHLLFNILKIVSTARIIFDDKLLTIIRIREKGSITVSDPKNNLIRFIRLRISFIEYLRENKKSYFDRNKEVYYEQIYKWIREVSVYNRSLSEKLYSAVLPKRYAPKKDRLTSKKFLILNRIIGYKLTMKIQSLQDFFKN